MKIEQRDLEYFAIVAEHGNLGHAAEVLGLTQPALSMSLRRLERATKSKVVRRTATGIELTDAGATLLKHVSRLRVAHEDVLREVSDIGQGLAGHLRIGSNLGASPMWFSTACGKFFNEAPRATIAFTVSLRAELLRALRAGEHDFLLATTATADGNDLTLEHLRDNEFAVCCSRRHPLARAKRVLCADLVNERWVVGSGPHALARLQGVFEKRGLPPPKVALMATYRELQLRTIATTNLLGLLVRSTIEDERKRLPLTALHIADWPPTWNQGAIIYRKNAYLSPAARRLIDLIKSTIQSQRRSG